MAKKVQELSALEVKRLSTPGMHSVGGVSGLYLAISKPGSRSWILRCMVGGKRSDIGLGGFPDVTLSAARDKARETREMISQGIDPIAEKKARRDALKAARLQVITFKEAAEHCHRKKAAEFKNLKHSAQWLNTLKTYAFPVIGHMNVKDIELHHIEAILNPIWHKKTETATRVRQRMESVFAWCTVSEYRQGENPARWSGHLDAIFPAPAKVKKLKGDAHHSAMPYKEVPAFLAHIRTLKGISARALEFIILTATRSGEVREAVWSEINIKEKAWIIPASRMKAGREHRVPLSSAAIELLNNLPRFLGTNYIFPSIRKKVALTSEGLAKPLKKYNSDYTVHGMRSAFRDWISETTDYQNIVAEMALAHTIKSATEAAYRRGDLFDKRVELMTTWSKYCQSHAGGQVVQLSR